MSVKIKKIHLVPVPRKQEVRYLINQTLKLLGDARKIIDENGSRYDHEVPWRKGYACEAKFYLYRVTIGAIGRVNTCEDAAALGVVSGEPFKTRHFTSYALYLICRLARSYRRQLFYTRRLEQWLAGLLSNKDQSENIRYLNYYNMVSEYEEEEKESG